jgi:hypothetical protein
MIFLRNPNIYDGVGDVFKVGDEVYEVYEAQR